MPANRRWRSRSRSQRRRKSRSRSRSQRRTRYEGRDRRSPHKTSKRKDRRSRTSSSSSRSRSKSNDSNTDRRNRSWDKNRGVVLSKRSRSRGRGHDHKSHRRSKSRSKSHDPKSHRRSRSQSKSGGREMKDKLQKPNREIDLDKNKKLVTTDKSSLNEVNLVDKPKIAVLEAEASKKKEVTTASLDDLLLNSESLYLQPKPAENLAERYEKQEINVLCIHGSKNQARSSGTSSDDAQIGFNVSEIIALVHENNRRSTLQKTFKQIFDREEIISFVKEEPQEIKVIRKNVTQEDLKKVEEKFFKTSSTEKRDDRNSDKPSKHEMNPRDSRLAHLFRETERKKYAHLDSELIDQNLNRGQGDASSRMDVHEVQSKMSIRDRLGTTPNSDKTTRYDRLVHVSDDRSRKVQPDLRKSITGREAISQLSAAGVAYLGQKSVTSSSDVPEDFSHRPDKGKVDLSAFDPTIVPRGGRYDEHDDRDRGRGSSNFDSRVRGRKLPANRFNPRGGERSRRPHEGQRRDNRKRKPEEPEWTHDKFDELEKELIRAEPTSTTN